VAGRSLPESSFVPAESPIANIRGWPFTRNISSVSACPRTLRGNAWYPACVSAGGRDAWGPTVQRTKSASKVGPSTFLRLGPLVAWISSRITPFEPGFLGDAMSSALLMLATKKPKINSTFLEARTCISLLSLKLSGSWGVVLHIWQLFLHKTFS